MESQGSNRIKIEYEGVKVDTTKEQLAGLMNRIIMDDDFRAEFNRNQVEILSKEGITVDKEAAGKLEKTSIANVLSKIASGAKPEEVKAAGCAVVVVIAAVIVLSTPSIAE